MAKEALGQDSLIGRVLGHYRIVEEIGAGGMGVVYRAHDEHLDRNVAVKVLPPGLLADDKARQHFHKEAHTLSRLSHPNIATIYDFDSCDGIDYLAEELVSGVSLERMLSSGPLSEREIVNFGTQLCEGLAAAHARGILHRDIKPSNLLVAEDGQLKIVDFGLAKTTAVEGFSTDNQATLSAEQVVAGTLPYMSPEQLRNEKLDARTDIWAAGCVLYEMATARRPFRAEGTPVINEILTQAPSPPSRLNHKISAGLEAIIQKCLEKDAGLRYGSAHEIAVDLRRLSASATFAPATRRRRVVSAWKLSLIALVAIALALAALAIWKLLPRHSAIQHKSIAVLSFRNMSGDTSLDWLNSGLPELLTTNLSQMRGMDVLSREQVYRAMKRKGRQDTPDLPPEVALDVARDAGADTCVTGSVMKLGTSKLRVDLHVQDARTGKILSSDKAESEDISGIFTMVDAMTARLAERIVPAAQTPGSNPQVAEIMTANAEAMRHYQAGLDYQQKMQFERAEPEYEEAVRLDPQFGMAHLRLWFVADSLQHGSKADAAFANVKRLQARFPREEQLRIASLQATALGDSDASILADEELARQAPRRGLLGLAVDLQYDDPNRAVALARESVALDPSNPRLNNDVAYVEAMAGNEAAALAACDRYRAMQGANEPNVWDTRSNILYLFGHDDEAAASYRRALELDPNWTQLGPELALIYADQGKHELAMQEIARFREMHTKGFSPLALRMFEAQLAQARGAPEWGLQLYTDAILEFLAAGQPENAYRASFSYATLALMLQREQQALVSVRRQSLPQHRELLTISMLQAAAGEDFTASLQEYGRANPQVPAAVLKHLQTLNTALTAVRRRDRAAAARVLPDLLVQRSRSDNYRVFLFFFVRARVRLLTADYAGAERDFRTAILDTRNLASPFYTKTAMPIVEQLSHFYLGQIYEQAGRRDEAVREYRKFLEPYAKSTSRLPQLAEARASLKRLQG